jgi:hypothetical protein
MQLPFFRELEAARTVLLAGAGGGFDVFATLPLYLWLRSQGKKVHLASLSFTDLTATSATRLGGGVVKVTASCHGPLYFPELALCDWLAYEGQRAPVYTFSRGGVQDAVRAYAWLAEALSPDTVVLVDGGTDILMRGDEAALGTPNEDIASLLAVDALAGVERKMVACVGFGVDTYHGVSHGLALENMAALVEAGHYLGAWSLTPEMEEARLYAEAVRFANRGNQRMPSIVNNSVVSATLGWFGDRHFTDRTAGSTLFLSPLMSLFWTFRLEGVAANLLYRDKVMASQTYFELSTAIERFRARLPQLRQWRDIPH